MAGRGKTTQGLFNVKRTGDSALGDAKASSSGLGKAGPGGARLGMAWRSKTTQGLYNVKRTGDSALGDAKASLSRLGEARRGLAGPGLARQLKARFFHLRRST